MATPSPLSAFQTTALFDIRNLAVVITGGSSGLGLYAAHSLATNGARVYILGRNQAALTSAVSTFDRLSPSLRTASPTSPPGTITPIQADVTDKQSLASAAASISTLEGGNGIDLLLCNAGIGGRLLRSYGTSPFTTASASGADADADSSPFLEMVQELDSFSFEEARHVLDVNLLGSYFTALAFLPLLKVRADRYTAAGADGGAEYVPQVILVSSNAAWAKLPILNPIYNLSKTGVSQLGQMLSTMLAQSGIRVNTVEPGLYPSALTSNEPPNPETGHSTLSHTNGADIPAGRCGRPEEHAATILYLASRAALFANGATLRIDGGALQRIPASQ